MITISQAVQDIIKETPFLEDGLARGIINLSALARQIKPRIAKRLYKKPTDAAIIMALLRSSFRLKKKSPRENELKNLRNLTVRSGLVEYAFHPSTSLFSLQKELFSASEHDRELFVSLSQGLSEVTLITSADLVPKVEKLIPKRSIIDKIVNLAAITLKLRPEHIYIPGVQYSLLKALAWEDINIIETISTYSEITLVVENKDLDRAFSCIQKATASGS